MEKLAKRWADLENIKAEKTSLKRRKEVDDPAIRVITEGLEPDRITMSETTVEELNSELRKLRDEFTDLKINFL